MFKRAFFSLTLLFSLASSSLQSEQVPALDLVVWQRADIMAKYIYAKHRAWKTSSLFGKQIYYRHLQLWNHFFEDEPPKSCFEDYFDAFNQLLDSIEKQGFDHAYAVLLDHGGAICNGAHRVTSCLLYDQQVPVRRCSDARNYGFEFFQNLGLETTYLDAMALQYCELKPNCHVLLVFPCAVGYEKQIEGIIWRYGKLVYKKQIPFSANGGVHLVLTMYEGEPWVGNIDNDYEGARYKAQGCFPESMLAKQPLRVYLLESEDLDCVKACKAQIRALFNHRQDAAHASDTHEEAIVLARSLFNQNSVHCLNHRKDAFFPTFERYLQAYQRGLKEKESDWFCVDGGAVLAAYGLRDCSDFDVLHYESDKPAFEGGFVESHNEYLHFHAWPLDDILFDPDYHFFYRGVKFCSLEVIRAMKGCRQEPKDFRDIALMDLVEPSERPHTSYEGMPLE